MAWFVCEQGVLQFSQDMLLLTTLSTKLSENASTSNIELPTTFPLSLSRSELLDWGVAPNPPNLAVLIY